MSGIGIQSILFATVLLCFLSLHFFLLLVVLGMVSGFVVHLLCVGFYLFCFLCNCSLFLALPKHSLCLSGVVFNKIKAVKKKKLAQISV
jgi:hypothetical protein